MQATVLQLLAAVSAAKDKEALSALFKQSAAYVNTIPLTTAGLVIKAGASTLTKTGATAFYALVNGRLVTIAGATDMPALTGLVITANSFNVACFFVDSAGVVTARFGTEGTALGRVKFPDFPVDKALIGFLIITHSATFTGGTTALDTATTVYVSPLGAVDPSFLFA